MDTSTWGKIGQAIDAAVQAFNTRGDRQFDVLHMGPEMIQVLEKQLSTNIAIVQVQNGLIDLTCPINTAGVPRLAKFRIKDGQIIWTGDITGYPKPPKTPMTPEQFAVDILKPLFKPTGNVTAVINERGIVIQFNALLDNISSEKWDALLDELKSHPIPSFYPNGKRMMIDLSDYKTRVVIYFTNKTATIDEAIPILEKYGIEVFDVRGQE